MDNKKLFLFLLLGIFLISFVSASVSTYGLKSYYYMNESSGTVRDIIGAYNLSSFGTVNYNIIGKLNNAIAVTASGASPSTNRLQIATHGGLTTNNNTLSFWFKFNANGSNSNMDFLSNSYPGASQAGMEIMIESNKLVCRIADNAYVGSQAQYQFNYNTNWNFATCVFGRTANTIELWYNGVNVANGSWDGRSLIENATLSLFSSMTGVNGNANYSMDEVSIWNRSLTYQELAEIYNSGNGNVYPFTGVGVTLNSPTNNSVSLVNGNLTFNWTSTGVNALVNTSLYIDGVLNETINISGTSNTTLTYKNFTTNGEHSWYVNSCTATECANSSINTFEIRYFTIDSISYNSSVYETAETTLGINLTYLSSIASISVILQYAGVNYTTINSGSGDDGIYTTTLSIPVVNISTNNTFFWWVQSVADTTEVYTTDSYNQTINPLVFTICNATYSNVGINFTYYNEITGSKINVSANPQTFQGTFNYWVGLGSIYKNYSIDNLNTTNSSYAFCISPFNDSSNQIKVNSNIYYTAHEFSSGNYYLTNATLFNTSSNISLWLLPSSSASSFTITTYIGVTTFKQASVTISKYFEGEGIYKTVAMARTDSSGIFTVDLQSNKQYSFSYSKDGVSYGTIYKTATCSSTPCELDIQITQDTYDLFSGYYDTYAQNVAYNLYYNNTVKMVYASFNDLTGLAVYFRLVVLPSSLNETQTAVCDVYSYSTSGTLSCNMTGYTGDYVAKLYISRSPEKLVHLIGFVANTIQENIGTVALFISLIFLLVIVFSGMRNPSIAVALVPIALVVLKLIDFNPLSWLTISAIAFLAILLIGRLKT